MHTNTTRATQNTTFPRPNRRKPQPYQHILSDLTVEAKQLKTPISPTTPTKTRNKNNTKCPIVQFLKLPRLLSPKPMKHDVVPFVGSPSSRRGEVTLPFRTSGVAISACGGLA